MAEEELTPEERRWRIDKEIEILNSDKETLIDVIDTDVTAQWIIFTLVAAIEAAGVPVLQNLTLGTLWYPLAAFLEILLGVFWRGSTQRIQKGIDIRRREVKDIEIRLRELAPWVGTKVYTDPELLRLESLRIRTRHYIGSVMLVFMLLWIVFLGRGIVNLPPPSVLAVLLFTIAIIIAGIGGLLVWFVWIGSLPVRQ